MSSFAAFGAVIAVAAGCRPECAPTLARCRTTHPVASSLPLASSTAGRRGVGVFTPPELRVERGNCWVRLLRLDTSTLERIRAAFLERNPSSSNIHVNPFTGLVEGAIYPRPLDQTLASAARDRDSLEDHDYNEKRLEPFLRNADLIGMTPSDIRALVWSDNSLGGDSPSGRLRLENTVFSSIRAAEIGWHAEVTLDRRLVSSFQVFRQGPPLDFCTHPAFAAERVRSSPVLRKRFSEWSGSMDEPELTIYAQTDRRRSNGEPSSKTWFLAWRVRAAGFVMLDATTGEFLDYLPAPVW